MAFLREREGVRNEIRGRNRSAEGLIPQLTLASIYPKGHAYAQMVGGDDAQLSTITLGDACEFMQKYYAPDRATLIIAGGIAAEVAIGPITKWFNVIDKRAPAPRRVVDPITVTNERKTFELDLERPWVTVAWALPDERTPEGEAAQLGILRAFFDAARKADEYECATQAIPASLGGREAPVFLIALELHTMGKLDDRLRRRVRAPGARSSRELDPKNEVVVVLGDRASVAKAFADAGIQGVKLVEPDYK